MIECTSYEVIAGCMTQHIRAAMNAVRMDRRTELTEVRVRSGRPVSFVYRNEIKFLTRTGRLTLSPDESECIRAAASDIAQIVNALCRYSMHSCPNELREGYFVIGGGVRVGAAGSVSEASGHVMRGFNALNFRIAREMKGCAEEVYNTVSGGSVLICGGVNSGKTTLLRDLCRLSGRCRKTVLIDERNELAAVVAGEPTMDVGVMTDVLVGTSRAQGITSAVRTLSPEIIFCDEISTSDDAQAILSAHGCGVSLAATLHACDYSDMMKRCAAKSLIGEGVFDYAVFLGGQSGPFSIKEIRRLKK